MPYIVRTPEGLVNVPLPETATVAQLMSFIESETGIAVCNQILSYFSQLLSSELVLRDVMDNMSIVDCDVDMDGGKKKRKKKQYTTPKRKPHVFKKVPLAVLKYYSIKDGKVVRLRRSCPNCGPGVRLAIHKKNARISCGKCGKRMEDAN